jgi:hypothetical protein
MPYTTEWTPPELFMTHNGVNVFHAYKDDDMDAGRLTYWYTLDASEDGHAFDVRDLAVPARATLDQHPPFQQGEHNTSENRAAWEAWHREGEPGRIKQILREALDTSLLVADPEANADPNAPTSYCQVLVEVRRTDGKALDPGEALAMVNEMVSEGERQARRNLSDGGVGGQDYLVTICEFSVTLPCDPS